MNISPYLCSIFNESKSEYTFRNMQIRKMKHPAFLFRRSDDEGRVALLEIQMQVVRLNLFEISVFKSKLYLKPWNLLKLYFCINTVIIFNFTSWFITNYCRIIRLNLSVSNTELHAKNRILKFIQNCCFIRF